MHHTANVQWRIALKIHQGYKLTQGDQILPMVQH